MTAIDTKKLELQDKITRLPEQVRNSRADAIGKYLLALEMQDGSGDPLSDGTIAKMEQLGIVKSAIKGKAASSSSLYTNRHVGSYPFKFNTYSASDGLSGPITTSIGYQFTPLTSGTLTNENCANYYLVSKENDDGNLVLCNLSEDGDAFTSPSKSTNNDILITSELKTQGSLPYTFIGYAGSGDYSNKSPIFKSTGSTLDVYVASVKIAEIDQYGIFTNVSNTIGATIDVDTSIYNFGSGQIDLVFTELPTEYNASVELRYNYVATSIQADTESPDSFNSDTGVFKFILNDEPVLNSVVIKVNGEQKAMIMDDGSISGMTVVSSYSFYNLETNVLKIRFRDIMSADPDYIVTVDYVVKNEVTEISDLGSINATSITYSNIEIPTTNPDIIEDGFKLSFVENYTEETEVRIDMSVTLSGTTISGSYVSQGGSGMVNGTIVQATDSVPGSVSITLSTTAPILANPPTDSAIVMTFDHLTGRSDWEETYNYVDITSVSTLTSSVNGSVTMNKLNITSGSLDESPVLLDEIHVKSYSDHSVYGYITVICWGLQVNPSWSWYTGSASLAAAESCMMLTHDEFVSLFGWMDLSNHTVCDIVASIHPDHYSNATENPEDSGIYPQLYDQPFFPVTPPEFQESYLYRGSFHKTKKVEPDEPDYPLYPPAGLVDAYDYSVNSDIRWIADVMPSEDDMMDSTYTFTNPYQTAIDTIASFSSAETTTIPQSSNILIPPAGGGSTASVYSIDDTEEGYYIVYVTDYTAEDLGGEGGYGWVEGETSEFTCYFNDIQHQLHAEVNPIPEGEISAPSSSAIRNIADDDSYQNVIDVSTAICQTLTYTDSVDETTFYGAVDTFDVARAALLSYNSSWVASFDTSSSSYNYVTTSMIAYINASSTFSTAIDTELTSIGSRMGSPTSAGYAKNLYDTVNLMLALDIEYIKKLLEDFTSMEGSFQTAVDDHNKWDLYNGI